MPHTEHRAAILGIVAGTTRQADFILMTGSSESTGSRLRRAAEWKPAGDHEYGDIRFEVASGIAKITICRPEVRNAFRPQTLFELQHAFNEARDDPDVGCIILTGEADEACSFE